MWVHLLSVSVCFSHSVCITYTETREQANYSINILSEATRTVRKYTYRNRLNERLFTCRLKATKSHLHSIQYCVCRCNVKRSCALLCRCIFTRHLRLFSALSIICLSLVLLCKIIHFLLYRIPFELNSNNKILEYYFDKLGVSRQWMRTNTRLLKLKQSS